MWDLVKAVYSFVLRPHVNEPIVGGGGGGCNHLLYCRLCMIYSIIKHFFAGTKIFDLLRSCLLKHLKIFYIK